MPELPEVENILQSLEKAVLGKKILRVEILRQDSFLNNKKLQNIKGGSITAINRRGKWLLMQLDNGCTLLFHLGMTGRLTLLKQGSQPPKYALLSFFLKGGKNLIFSDMRRFGRFEKLATSEVIDFKALKSLGAEPFTKDFDISLLAAILGKSKRQIKDFLLDQGRIAGIGNIYSCEILFDSKISPFKPADKLTAEEINRLYQSIHKILSQAIAEGGSTVKSYVNPAGKRGSFQIRHQVYGREGKTCLLCSTSIRREKQHGRSTFFCPKCQPQKNRK